MHQYNGSVKIVVVLSGSFPTQKAYGVTTLGTLRALSQKGHKTILLSRTEVMNNLLSKGAVSRLVAKFWETSINSKRLSGIFFPVWQVFMCFQLRHLIPRDTDLIWSREPILAYFLSVLIRVTVVVELHHVPQRFNRLVMHRLKRDSKVVVAPIKSSIRDELKLDALTTPIANMAVNDEFLRVGKARISERDLKRKIVVLGKVSNMHQRVSHEQLFRELQSLGTNTLPATLVAFIGIDDIFQSRLSIAKNGNLKLQFMGHIVHETLPIILSEFDIGIIPYSENRYFRDTFPIKAVEYAATKILIVASDTVNHKQILQDRAFYYSFEEEGSLSTLLTKIWSGELDTGEVIEKAYQWAQSKTYSRRVDKILENVVTVTNLR